MNILLIGDYYSSNLGDGVICQTLFELLERKTSEGTEIDILDINGRESFIESETSFYKKSVLNRGLKKVMAPSIEETIKFKKKKLNPIT